MQESKRILSTFDKIILLPPQTFDLYKHIVKNLKKNTT